ncbi:uncharacterized protein LOC117217338 [Megalopta genalis]|uniref:uncharacterized protein LOC117217338 n=1 Tax=Megalopta genalis TaxID=115081 RepID=UPI003FD266F2
MGPGERITMASGESIEIKDAFVYSRRTFLCGGIWPQQRIPVLFKMAVFYLSWSMALSTWAAYDVQDDLQLMIFNLMESIIIMSIIFETSLVWLSDDLKSVVDEARREMQNGVYLKNVDEKRLYYKYNNISWKFGKYATVFQFALIILMFFRPLIHLSVQSYAGESNATIFYTLPFRAHIFFDYQNNIMIYFILYVYQVPLMYVAMFHIAEVSFIVTMVLHLCGKFSILCFRIRNVTTKSSSLFQKNIKSVVNQHLELRKMSEILNNSFYLLLLIEYVSCSSRLSLSMYVVLTTLNTDPVAAANFVMYTLDVTAYLYLYSYIGEQLRCESENIGDALYNIEWQEVTDKDRRVLLICMTNGQKTECLTAGKFYEFSLFGFTKIFKFSMAFFSMLRARIEA